MWTLLCNISVKTSPLVNGLGTTHAISLSETSHVIHRTSCTAESKQQSFLIGPEQKEKEKGKPGHNTLIMRGSFWLVQIISCSVRGSRLLLEDQNTDCTLIPNPIDLRGWVSCTQFQQNSLTSGHVFVIPNFSLNFYTLWVVLSSGDFTPVDTGNKQMFHIFTVFVFTLLCSISCPALFSHQNISKACCWYFSVCSGLWGAWKYTALIIQRTHSVYCRCSVLCSMYVCTVDKRKFLLWSALKYQVWFTRLLFWSMRYDLQKAAECSSTLCILTPEMCLNMKYE